MKTLVALIFSALFGLLPTAFAQEGGSPDVGSDDVLEATENCGDCNAHTNSDDRHENAEKASLQARGTVNGQVNTSGSSSGVTDE